MEPRAGWVGQVEGREARGEQALKRLLVEFGPRLGPSRREAWRDDNLSVRETI